MIVEWAQTALVKLFGSRNQRLLEDMLPKVEAINMLETELSVVSDAELAVRSLSLRERLVASRQAKGYDEVVAEAKRLRHAREREQAEEVEARAASLEQEALGEALVEAFALVREASKRTLGMRHYDVQLIGGIVLHEGKIAEMVTGEGKTLVATLPCYLNALAGHGVHVVTVNDYLARRDRDWNAPVFEMLGLRVGVIQQPMGSAERQVEYGCDITYGTNNEFGFDYLRDNMKVAHEDQCQGKLHYALIDEVDSILIDEARTPLIISGMAEEATSKYYTANRVAQALRKDEHYEVKEKEHLVVLTEDGVVEAQRLVGVDDFYTGANMDWPHHIDQALKAKELYLRDKQYVVNEGEIVIVDEHTGRLMSGRTWSDGLHQAIEAKEGVKIKRENQTLATVTLQNYFRLYTKLSGMTGTAQTEADELHSTYKLDVVGIPTNKPLIRHAWADVVYRTEGEKYKAILDEIDRVHVVGRPMLVGTISVENSEKLSDLLSRRGVNHEVLNAKNHEREANIVTSAGQLRSVCVATNMAGRGTDIILGRAPQQGDDLTGIVDWVNQAFWRRGRQRLRLEHVPVQIPEAKRVLLDYAEAAIRDELAVAQEATGAKLDTDALFAGDEGTRRKSILKALRAVGIKDELEAFRRAEPLVTMLEARDNIERVFVGGVAAMGGLHVLATERHESRRIDNQLRGRCGRQGDPGSSQFFLSLEDDLMRIFAPERVSNILERLGMSEGQEISHPMVSKAIERAQKKVEARNFDIRKNLLEYDQVMDDQRKLIYEIRNTMLEGADTKALLSDWLVDVIGDSVDTFASDQLVVAERNYDGLVDWVKARFGVECTVDELKACDGAGIEKLVLDRVRGLYETREADMGAPAMRQLERFLVLQKIDEKWKDHLHGMDQLRSGIGMRGYAQTDPKIAYKKEGFELFYQMVHSVKDDVCDLLFKVRLVNEDEERLLGSVWRQSGATAHGPAKTSTDLAASPLAAGDPMAQQGRAAAQRAAERRARVGQPEGSEPRQVKTLKAGPRVERNAPCPCGSGKKYKKCCAGKH